jgi:hypothetical protein
MDANALRIGGAFTKSLLWINLKKDRGKPGQLFILAAGCA